MTVAEAFKVLREKRTQPWTREFEQAFEFLLDEGRLEECGCCGGYHPSHSADILPDPRSDYYGGDCRDNNNRF